MLHFFAKRLAELHEVERDERGFTLIELLVVITLPFHKRLPWAPRPN
jgi:Prokaryotic N-terminal methylation motif